MALQENKTDQSIAQILNLSYAFRTQRTESSTFRSYQTIYQQNLTIEAHMVREESNYMRDYILDEQGMIRELDFNSIETDHSQVE